MMRKCNPEQEHAYLLRSDFEQMLRIAKKGGGVRKSPSADVMHQSVGKYNKTSL